MGMDVKFETDNKIENYTREFKLKKAKYETEVNTANAEAQLAYKLQSARLQQNIKAEETKIQIVERKKQIEIEEQEIKGKEKELTGTIKLPAEAQSFKVQIIAEGRRTQTVEAARADAEKVKLVGAAEAKSIEAIGVAEAQAMR